MAFKDWFSGIQCRFNSPFVEHGASIFTQVFLIFLFLTLFFFMFVVKVEKEIFSNNINIIVDNVMNDWGRLWPLVVPIDPSKTQEWKQNALISLQQDQQQMNNPSPEMAATIQEVIDQNNRVEQSAHYVLIALGILVGVGLLTLVILRFCLKTIKHFWENILLIFFIGLTEFLFLELVIKNYVSVNPNKVKLFIMQSISNFATQQQLQQYY